MRGGAWREGGGTPRTTFSTSSNARATAGSSGAVPWPPRWCGDASAAASGATACGAACDVRRRGSMSGARRRRARRGSLEHARPRGLGDMPKPTRLAQRLSDVRFQLTKTKCHGNCWPPSPTPASADPPRRSLSNRPRLPPRRGRLGWRLRSSSSRCQRRSWRSWTQRTCLCRAPCPPLLCVASLRPPPHECNVPAERAGEWGQSSNRSWPMQPNIWGNVILPTRRNHAAGLRHSAAGAKLPAT